MRAITKNSLFLIVTMFAGVLFIQACKKENEVTVRAQIEDTWYAQSITTTYANSEGDGISGTDDDQNWSIKFDDGNYTINGEYDIIDSNGTYSINGDDMTLYPQNGDPVTWKIDNVNSNELVAEYSDSDDDGEFTVRIEFTN